MFVVICHQDCCPEISFHLLDKVDLCISQAHWTILDEFQALQEDLTFVNKVQAKYSPVLIIQRYIRGYLARSRCGYEKEKRLW